MSVFKHPDLAVTSGLTSGFNGTSFGRQLGDNWDVNRVVNRDVNRYVNRDVNRASIHAPIASAEQVSKYTLNCTIVLYSYYRAKHFSWLVCWILFLKRNIHQLSRNVDILEQIIIVFKLAEYRIISPRLPHDTLTGCSTRNRGPPWPVPPRAPARRPTSRRNNCGCTG